MKFATKKAGLFLVLVFGLCRCEGGGETPETPETPGTPVAECGSLTLKDVSVFSATDGSYFDRVVLSWQTPFLWQEVLSDGAVGGYADLAIDTDSSLHASLKEQLTTGGRLLHAWKDPDECWQSEVVDESAANLGAYTSIALAGDEIHIAYVDQTNSNIRHAWKEGEGAWQTETVATDASTSLASVGLALSGDTVHIVYKGNAGLVHAYKNSSWQTETIVSGFGQYAKIMAQSDGTLHVVYHTASTGGVSYATKSGSGDWSIAVVDSDQVGLFLDLDFISTTWDGYLATSYFDSENDQLKMAWKSLSSSTWNVEMVDNDGKPGWYTSITATSSAAPVVFHISYQDSENMDLKHAWKESTANSWNTETLDTDGSTGAWTAIAVDILDQTPHIIYYDTSSTALNHAFVSDEISYTVSRREADSSASWTELTTVTSTSYEDTAVTQEVIYEYQLVASLGDSTTNPVTDTGYADAAQVIDEDGDVGKYSRIAVADDGTLHIAYYDDDSNDLKHAWKSSSSTTWSTEVVDSEDAVGEYAGLALATDGSLHISYFSQTDTKLKHAWATSESGGSWNWSVQTVENSGHVGLYTDMAAHTDGSVHISYKIGGTDANLKHARGTLSGSTWTWSTATVDTQDDVGSYSSIFVQTGGSGSGDVHISYYEQVSNAGALKYAFGDWDSSNSVLTWTTETIDNSSNNVGEFTSVTVAGTRLHISYHDTTLDVLKHAWKDLPGGDWNTAVVDEGTALGFAGKHSALVVSSDGGVHIAHYADSSARLDLTTGVWNTANSAYEWSTQTLDEGSGLGQFADVAVGADGTLHISYYDGGNGALKYIAVTP